MMTTKTIPTYRRQRRKGKPDRAFVQLGERRVYLGAFGSEESRQAYTRAIAEWQASGCYAEPTSDLSVAELLDRFTNHAERYYRRPDGSLSKEPEDYALAVRPLLELYPDLPAVDFGPRRLKTVRDRMIAGGWSRPYVNQQIGRIKRVFRWGASEELFPAAVYDALRTVEGLRRGRSAARETQPVAPVPEADIDAIRPYIPRQVEALVDLQLLTGARPGEWLSARACDVDMGGDTWVFTPRLWKLSYRGDTRRIYCGPKAVAILGRFLAGRPTDAYLFDPREAVADRAAKASTHRRRNQRPNKRRTKRRVGDHYDTRGYAQAIAYACERAGVARWSPGRLRHNAATMLRTRFGLEAAQVILGHAKADTTQVYALRDEKCAIEAIRQVG